MNEDWEREFRERIERARAELDRARAQGERQEELREREREIERLAREHERQGRERERERNRAERHREREQRREERRARHEQRHEFHIGRHGFDLEVNVDPDEIARSVNAAFVGIDDDADAVTHDENLEKVFTVEGMPRVRVRNVSGETTIRTGEPGVVRVVARKRVKGTSADRAKRLLENVDVRAEQTGNEILIEPHLYEQERSWLDLFRGKRFRVDFEITVPRETALDAQTVSGEIDIRGTRGPARIETVSGDVQVTDLQGPMRIKSVSGDVQCNEYVGAVEGSSVSGDVDIRGRVRVVELHTVSGDVSVDVEPDGSARESRLKTISGDVEVGLIGASCVCDFHTASGDLECDISARVIREGRKDRTVIIGEGGGRLHVKTVSGDLTLRRASAVVTEEPVAETTEPAAEPESDVERTVPMGPPAGARGARVRDLLDKLARGEVSVDEAAAKLDETREMS